MSRRRIAATWPRGMLIALTSAIGLLAAAPSAFAYIYWVSNVKGQADTFRANLDGTGKRELPVLGADGEGMVAAGNYLYSVTLHGIARWDADGSHHRLLVRVNPSRMAGFDLTVAGSHIYWNSTDPTDNEVEISRANLDGKDVQMGYIKSSSNPMTGSELAVEGDRIYWFDEPTPDTVAIGRARVDGSDINENFIRFSSDASTQPYLTAAGPTCTSTRVVRGLRTRSGVRGSTARASPTSISSTSASATRHTPFSRDWRSLVLRSTLRIAPTTVRSAASIWTAPTSSGGSSQSTAAWPASRRLAVSWRSRPGRPAPGRLSSTLVNGRSHARDGLQPLVNFACRAAAERRPAMFKGLRVERTDQLRGSFRAAKTRTTPPPSNDLDGTCSTPTVPFTTKKD